MRTTICTTAVLLTTIALPAAAQANHSQGHGAVAASGEAALIANALSAAPASVAATASVVGHDGRTLKKGTSDWVCMPDMPNVPNDTPMCLDATWRAFMDAWVNKKTPSVTQMAFGYMLQGDMPVSNTDPFAQAPTSSNQWIPNGAPHVMILIPDARVLEALPTDPTSGGPFVMWKGTPYAHVMVPVSKRDR